MANAQVLPSLPLLTIRYPDLRIDLHADDHIVDLATDGIGCLNIAAVHRWVDAGGLVPILADFEDSTPFPICAVMLPDRRRLPRVRAVVEHLAKVFGPSRTSG